MEKLRPRGEVSSACQRPQSREQSPKGNPDSRRSPFRVLWARARLIQVAKRLGDSEPQGTHVTTLCSIRAAFPVSELSVVSGSEQPQQSPLAEGRGRKEVAAAAQGAPPGLRVGERRDLNVQGWREMLAFTPKLQSLGCKNTIITGLSFPVSKMGRSILPKQCLNVISLSRGQGRQRFTSTCSFYT